MFSVFRVQTQFLFQKLLNETVSKIETDSKTVLLLARKTKKNWGKL